MRTRSTFGLDNRRGPRAREQRQNFGGHWAVVRIQSDQPWADGLMQRSLFGRSGDTGPDGRMRERRWER